MKKVLAVVLTVCVVFGSAAAFAQPNGFGRNFEGHRNMYNMPQQMHRNYLSEDHHFDGRGPRGNFGGNGRGYRGCDFTPDMPKEIREKAVELAKLRIDLEEAMTSEPLNKAKAIETYKKIQALENEIEIWRFEKRLERIEKMKEFRQKRIEQNEKTEQ